MERVAGKASLATSLVLLRLNGERWYFDFFIRNFAAFQSMFEKTQEAETMESQSPLKDKIVLVVDDEPDVLESVEEVLDMCLVHTAGDYETALQYLLTHNYDIVILDIMGVKGFDLLKKAVIRGFPTVMLTAHALSPESLKKSIRLGAVSFLPKEEMSGLRTYLEAVVMGAGKHLWKRLFDRMGDYFDRKFGPDWKERDQFFKEFEKELESDFQKGS
jgi:CheY-like chemotaxis protein